MTDEELRQRAQVFLVNNLPTAFTSARGPAGGELVDLLAAFAKEIMGSIKH
jgi:hypothetical protein